MPADPRTPVLVGVGAVQQREEDPARAAEPLELMARALERAVEDAGSRALLERADLVGAPRGFWTYADPCRALAERFGAKRARTRVAEIGILQTTLLGGAASDIAAGRADVVLLCGGEARHRELRARALGVEAPLCEAGSGPADEVLRPEREILHPAELALGLAMPVQQYAVLENALRAAEGQDLAEHRDAVARLWAGMSRVAARNPDAWSREAVDAATIREPGPRNRALAFPYNKLHTSQWNVDQAAGLVLCSLATARALGLPEARFVYPLAVADANAMLPLSERRALYRCPGFAHAGEHAFVHAGLTPGEVPHRELYSCFPVAVRMQQRELGLAEDAPVTVTGGMTFAGGPLNNFVLQAVVKMAQVLRADPGSAGLVNAVSGILTKQGVSLWSSAPPRSAFALLDVSAETRRATGTVQVVADATGRGRVAGATVLAAGEGPGRTVALVDLPEGRRTLAASDDPALAERATREEIVGREAEVAGGALRAVLGSA